MENRMQFLLCTTIDFNDARERFLISMENQFFIDACSLLSELPFLCNGILSEFKYASFIGEEE
jgi:hypothetical protein